jgi:hypothetical protein
MILMAAQFTTEGTGALEKHGAGLLNPVEPAGKQQVLRSAQDDPNRFSYVLAGRILAAHDTLRMRPPFLFGSVGRRPCETRNNKGFVIVT